MPHLSVRAAAPLLLLLSACGPTRSAAPPPTPSVVSTARPASAATRDAIVAAAGATPETRSVVILVDGTPWLAEDAPGTRADELHDTRSIGKSITALAVGAAIGAGTIPSVDESVLAAWPEHAGAPAAGMRYRDLLTMRSALDCDDGVATSPGQEDHMHEQRDWTAWVLALPRRPEADLGGPLRYCTANAFLIGQAVARRVGRRFDAFVDDALLRPLGITRRQWMTSPTDEVMTGGGLRLTSRDLATLGELVRRRGRWGERQLVPADFMADATTVHASAGPGRDYGYLLWRYAFAGPCGPAPAWFMAGNGGSVVAVFDDLRAVVVIVRAAYNRGQAAGETIALVEGAILPGLVDAAGGCAAPRRR
ncbi:MAG: serine hydrolase [Kofleriaceae bacterium]|nr:serine hydrolase [Kofleriaceae bacterium]